MIPINYNHLYYFYRIAQEGTIAKASKAVLISSPALSMQLKEFELTLGTPLFEREKKHLVLTETGHTVFEYAKEIFQLGDELAQVVKSNTQGRIKIDIGAQDSIPKHVTDHMISYLLKSAKCKVKATEGSLQSLIDLQKEFLLDVMLVDKLPTTEHENFYASKKIVEEPIKLFGVAEIVSKDALKNFEKIPLIVPTFQSGRREKIENFFQQQKILPNIIAEIEDSALEVKLAIDGVGAIATIESAVKDELASGSLNYICDLDEAYEQVWMIVRKRKILNPMAIQLLNEYEYPHR